MTYALSGLTENVAPTASTAGRMALLVIALVQLSFTGVYAVSLWRLKQRAASAKLLGRPGILQMLVGGYWLIAGKLLIGVGFIVVSIGGPTWVVVAPFVLSPVCFVPAWRNLRSRPVRYLRLDEELLAYLFGKTNQVPQRQPDVHVG